MSPTSPSIWRAQTGGQARVRGGSRRAIDPAVQHILRGLPNEFIESVRQLAERDFPGLWDALTETGREQFSLDLMRAVSRPPEDRGEAVRKVVQAWVDAWQLRMNAPLDDEPLTDEDRRDIEEAREAIARGEVVPLE